jgi:hypothetical protein
MRHGATGPAPCRGSKPGVRNFRHVDFATRIPELPDFLRHTGFCPSRMRAKSAWNRSATRTRAEVGSPTRIVPPEDILLSPETGFPIRNRRAILAALQDAVEGMQYNRRAAQRRSCRAFLLPASHSRTTHSVRIRAGGPGGALLERARRRPVCPLFFAGPGLAIASRTDLETVTSAGVQCDRY